MIIEAIRKDNGYFIPIKGKKKIIKVYLDENMENLDVVDFFIHQAGSKNMKELSKDEFIEQYGEELYRKYLLLDQKSMEDNWEYLVKTKKDHGEGFEMMEEAVSNWSKE